jgi:hypothetical protein
MKILFTTIMILGVFSYSNAISCDGSDPLCVAVIVFEKGISFRYNELHDYYCKENQFALQLAIKGSEIAIAEMKKKGIDYYKQAKNDFSDLHYELIKKTEQKAKVQVSGKIIHELEGTTFRHSSDEEKILDLKNINDSWVFCSDQLAKNSKRVLNSPNP